MESHELAKLVRYAKVSRAVSTLSKDTSTQLGAIILGKGFEIRAMGYNGFPRGVDDTCPERHERPLKYKWTEHAERNAIFNAARAGTATEGCRLLLDSPIFVCSECARAIIGAGIAQVVIVRYSDTDHARQDRWSEDEAIAREMLAEAGVEVEEILWDDHN